jgi:hypothetical protein
MFAYFINCDLAHFWGTRQHRCVSSWNTQQPCTVREMLRTWTTQEHQWCVIYTYAWLVCSTTHTYAWLFFSFFLFSADHQSGLFPSAAWHWPCVLHFYFSRRPIWVVPLTHCPCVIFFLFQQTTVLVVPPNTLSLTLCVCVFFACLFFFFFFFWFF